MARTHTRRRRRSGAQGGRVAVAQGSGHGLSDSGRQEMKRLLVILALTLLTPMPAQAANIKNIDLGRRAEVWFAEDHTVPIVSFNISLPAGSAYDPPGKAGLAAFTGAIIDESAGGLDSKTFHEAVANHA